jgi:hypothetical protein
LQRNLQSESVIDFEDKNAGKIIGNGSFHAYGKFKVVDYGYIKYVISIQVKNDRYKYIINSIRHVVLSNGFTTPGHLTALKPGGGLFSIGQGNWDAVKSNAFTDMSNLIQSLKDYMSKPSDRSSDDW